MPGSQPKVPHEPCKYNLGDEHWKISHRSRHLTYLFFASSSFGITFVLSSFISLVLPSPSSSESESWKHLISPASNRRASSVLHTYFIWRDVIRIVFWFCIVWTMFGRRHRQSHSQSHHGFWRDASMTESNPVPIHGNYYGYYNKRPSITDSRLALLPPEIFSGKTVLDIGCNEGWVTCEIGT